MNESRSGEILACLCSSLPSSICLRIAWNRSSRVIEPLIESDVACLPPPTRTCSPGCLTAAGGGRGDAPPAYAAAGGRVRNGVLGRDIPGPARILVGWLAAVGCCVYILGLSMPVATVLSAAGGLVYTANQNNRGVLEQATRAAEGAAAEIYGRTGIVLTANSLLFAAAGHVTVRYCRFPLPRLGLLFASVALQSYTLGGYLMPYCTGIRI